MKQRTLAMLAIIIMLVAVLPLTTFASGPVDGNDPADAPKVDDRPGLAYLARSAKDERLPAQVVLPGCQAVCHEAAHALSLGLSRGDFGKPRRI